MTLPTITQDRIELAPGDELILRFRTWDDYENLVARRHNKAGLRIRYSSATLMLLTKFHYPNGVITNVPIINQHRINRPIPATSITLA
jgi:hypothetical protein